MALQLTVLGCSSATPTSSRYPSAFLLKSNRIKGYFLIDCGEGTQIRMRRASIPMQRISRIFISHLHGDHFFGLIGYIFTQNLLGRQEELHIYAHKPLEKIIKLQLDVENAVLNYPLIFHSISPKKKKHTLYEDEAIEISTFPLLHSIPANGFLFREKGLNRMVREDFIEKYKPTRKQMASLKQGNDFVCKNGEVIKNDLATAPSDEYKSFAYCSDTAYTESIIPYIKQVDLLYHEATFLEELTEVAREKYHSTAKQAAEIAKLAKVKKLLVGHYSARYKDLNLFAEEAKSVFPNSENAFEGSSIKI